MNSDTRERFLALKESGRLPSPRGLATAIARLAGQDDVSTAEIVRLVKSDPAMAGRLLRCANAAHAGLHRHLASLTQAVVFLGLHRIRHLALAFSLLDQYRSGACRQFNYDAYWRGSIAMAIATEWLAPHAQVPPEDAFTCGLLADVGRLALATLFPERYGELLAEERGAEQLLQAEEGAFGITHPALSAELLDDWGLPPIFTAAVRFHEQPELAGFATGSRAESLVNVLHLAALIAQLFEQPDASDEAGAAGLLPGLHHAAARLGIDAAELQAGLAALATRCSEWCSELGLPAAPPDLNGRLERRAVMPPEHRELAPMRVGLVSERETAPVAAVAAALAETGFDLLRTAALPYHMPLPDIVLYDATGARQDNVEAVRRWRQVVTREQSFLIALVPAGSAALMSQLVSAGADDFLSLPCESAELVVRLRAAQQLVALQHMVRAERQLMIQQADTWARASRRLLHDAQTDPLTQLPNRRFGEDSLAEEWGLAMRAGTPMACIMLDIDHFKAINDRYGHELGDLVLRQLADILRETCRKNDVVFRYGGEEFCVICPAARRQDALALAERILAAVRGFVFGLSRPVHLTISAGVACRTGMAADASAEMLVAQADAALYEAKARGRDCVVIRR